MNLTRRSALAAGLAAPLLVAAGGSAEAVDYGSGQLGSWTSASKLISPSTIINRAVSRNGTFLFGDSITVFTARDLATRLYANGVIVAVNGWSIRPTTPTVDALEQWVSTYGAPRRIIMASGSNDIFNPPVMARQIRRTMDIVGPDRTVFWVNVQVSRNRQTTNVRLADQRNTGWVNAQIAEEASRHSNLKIIPWFEFLAAKPFRLTNYLSDGVHTSSTGIAARNELIRYHFLRG